MTASPTSGIYLDLNAGPITNSNKNKIMDVSIQFFAQRGYHAVSIRDITREVGIKESSFYNHFKGKQELLDTILHHFELETSKIITPLEHIPHLVKAMDPKAFLQRGLFNFKENIQAPVMDKIWRIVLMEQYLNSAARAMYMQEVVIKTLTFLEAVFLQYMETGQMKHADAAELAAEYQYPLFAMINEYVLLRIDGLDTDKLESRMLQHIDFFTGHVI